MKFWTAEQFSAFIKHVERPVSRVGFELLFWTGMRIGELLALDKTKFDFGKGNVSILHTYQRFGKRDLITEPKTKRSKRTIPLPPKIQESVLNYIERLYDYKDTERLFPYTKTFYYYEMIAGCKAANMEKIRLHDLRHSHASLLIEMGASLLLVSERLGHEDKETTLRTYGHLYPDKHDDIVQRMNELILE